ncbi:MAG: hypothetical protein ACQETG_09685 [Thermodesulfobacteriota bacterium]
MSDAGKDISKSVSVKTNDQARQWLRLRVSGEVEPYVTVEPRRVNLRGTAGEEVSQTVKIIKETDDPFDIRDVSAVRGENIELTLEKTEESGKKGYTLLVKNTRKKPGRYHDSIHLETDSERMSRITIAVSGIIESREE